MIHFRTFRSFLVIILTLLASTASAQIGYQVALLDNATGEARANESVKVDVKLTDSKGNVIFQEIKTETTNDFGILSMTIGNSTTFDNVDWANLPFFIEASANGRLIGKSQLLSVPIAEHAKHTGILTPEFLCSKNWSDGDRKLIFYSNGTWKMPDPKPEYTQNGTYHIEGNYVILLFSSTLSNKMLFYFPPKNWFVDTSDNTWK